MTQIKRVVGFSGGVDSQACALWVRQRFPPEEVLLLNTLAGRNEHPLTEQFIREYSETVFPVTTVMPLIRDLLGRGTKGGQSKARRDEFADDDELTFERLAYIKGRFPSAKAQFCTEHLKLVPQRRWCDEHLTAKGIDVERYIGVRRDESRRRSTVVAREWDDYFDCYVYRPIADWTKQQVFDFLKEHGEAINPLYLLGFNRVGCAPCINSSKGDVHAWAVRFPEMIDKVRAWEEAVGRTFFAPCVPGLVMNWVDQVVEWAATSHGGKQFTLPMFEAVVEAGTCISKYRLCE